MLEGNIKYLEDPTDGNVLLPITHINAVRDSNGVALPQLMDRRYPVDSKTAAQGGTDLSLVSTGEKYTWNSKADVATTIAGYGITDAKIENGTITLGSNTITPLTSHQDITGKADKSATVSTVSYDTTNKKITKTIDGVTTDVVTAEKLFQDSDATKYARKTDFDLSVLKQAVADGNLEKYGLKVGDQKTINGRTYVIAELNTMKGTTTPYRVNKNHVGLIVIPHTTQAWNASGNTYTGADSRGAGYKNSDLHYYLKNTLLPLVRTDLGSDNLISHYKLLSSSVDPNGPNKFGGVAAGCSDRQAWEENCYISALSEVQVYGAAICSSSLYDTGEACRQLEVFQKYSHTEIFGGEYPWLRDVASATHAALAGDIGNAAYNTASEALYVAALILFN